MTSPVQFEHTFKADVEQLTLDGGEFVFADPNVDERKIPPRLHAMKLDNCDSHNCTVRNYRGDLVTLTRTAKPGWGRRDDDIPVLQDFRGRYGHNGIVVDSVDWMIRFPRLMGLVYCGIDCKQGACAITAGQIYGADIGVITRPGASKVVIGADQRPHVSIPTEISDCRKAVVLLANYGKVDINSERCTEHNMLVGGQNELFNLDLAIEEFTTVRKDWTPTGVAFVTTPPNKPDPEFGPLCGNWSQMLGGSVRGLAPTTTKQMRLVHIDGAHMITIQNVTAGGYPGTIAFQAENGCEKANVQMTISGGRVILRNVGGGGFYDFYQHNGNIQLDPTSTWPSSTIVRIDRQEQRSAA